MDKVNVSVMHGEILANIQGVGTYQVLALFFMRKCGIIGVRKQYICTGVTGYFVFRPTLYNDLLGQLLRMTPQNTHACHWVVIFC